ncbi:hypothetical protein ACFRCQ_23280 [Cytobacillus firmus]
MILKRHFTFVSVGMEFADYIIGSGVKPGEVKEDSFASAKAEEWNKLFSK